MLVLDHKEGGGGVPPPVSAFRDFDGSIAGAMAGILVRARRAGRPASLRTLIDNHFTAAEIVEHLQAAVERACVTAVEDAVMGWQR